MKKSYIYCFLCLIGIVIISCQGSSSENRERDLDRKEKELNEKEERLLKEREENVEQKEREIKSQSKKVESKATAEKHIAVINDPDGYTNVRNGMSTEAKIIDRLYEGEHYEVFPSTDSNWWVVYTQSNVKGFVHKSRVRIID